MRIFEHQQAKLHVKVIIVDGIWEPRLEQFRDRSLSLNDEINSSVQHADLVGELERHFHDDLIASQELDLWGWSRCLSESGNTWPASFGGRRRCLRTAV